MDRILSIEYNKCENSGMSVLSVVDPDTYRVIFTVHNKEADNLYEHLTQNEFFNFNSPVVDVDKKNYNKAIDDFKEHLLSNEVIDKSVVRRVAEQLKN